MFHFPLDRRLRPLAVALIIFLFAAIAAATMIQRGEQHRREEERTRISNAAGDHADTLQRNIERALSVAYALAALVHQGNGTVSNFDAVGRQMLPFYPGVSSLSLAPGGIISSVVPLAGNEKAIGQHLLNNPETRKEASIARESGKLTLAGPFKLVQGEMAVIGRLPVFLDDPKGTPFFWGFINVVIRFPEVIERAGLPQLGERGIAYELWRKHPDTAQKQIIAASSSATPLIDPVEHTLELPNGNWTLSAAPVAGWGDPLGLSLKAALGLLVSLLLAYVVKLLGASRAHERELEALVAQRTAELQAREARFRLTFELAGSGIAHVHMDGRFLRVNRSLCAILGYSEEELVGRTVKELSHPEDRDKTDAARARVLSGERESMRFQKRYLRKDGATVWVDITVALVRDAGGNPLYEIAIFDDNTERKHAESALHESETRFRSLTEMSSDFYWESDAEHRITQRTAGRDSGASSVFWQGAQIDKRRWEVPYLSPDEAGWLAHRAVLDAHRPFRNFELSRAGTDGAEHFRSISGDPVFDASGAFKGYRGVGTDITERKRSEQALRDSAQKLRLFTDNIPAMTVSWDENLRCRFANKRYAEFFGFSVESILGKYLREVVGEEGYLEVEGHFVQAQRGHPVTYQRTHKLPSGEPRYLEIKLLPHLGDQGKVLGCFAVTTDITEHKLTEERIQRVAHHDSLTGLPNRLLFNDRLNQAISLAKRDSRQIALLYLDLDKFKPVNDALGHTAGDELLQAVAARIRDQVRESDTVARVGGDEFAVILPDIARREEAETVAKKIIDAFSTPFQLGTLAHSVDIGTSIGIAVYPADARDADALVRAADAAMYRAKQAGSSFRSYAA